MNPQPPDHQLLYFWLPENESGSLFRPQHAPSTRPHSFLLTIHFHKCGRCKMELVFSVSTFLVQKVNTPRIKQTHTKLLIKEVVGKLVKKVKLLEDKLKGRKRKFVMTDSDKEEDAEADVDPLIKLAKAAATAAAASAVPTGGSHEDAIPPSSYIPAGEFAGGSDVPAGATTTGPSADPSNKGKSPLLEEDPPVKERSFRQREEDSQVNTEESAVKPGAGTEEYIGMQSLPSDGPESPIGVDNRRITLIVIRARANSAVVVSLMEFVLVVLMEMEIKSIFQLQPDYSLDFNSPQDLHNLQQQNLCCDYCGGPHETFQCQPMNEDYYHEQNPCYDSNSFGFDQLQTPQFSVNHQPPQPMSMEALQAQEDLMKSIESFLKKFNRISFGKTPKVLLQAWDNFFEVKHAQSEEVQELLSKLVQDVKIISDELSEYINTPAWNRPLVYCDDDDDEDYTIAITPESPTKEPVNSLSLGDEHLDTIPATESDEFIKSSVENLVPTPIEFEDFSDDECDLPPYDDSSKNHDFTFSNPLFDIDEDFTLSDESFSEEDIPKENFIIFSNPLFDLDEEIASTKVDRINDEVLEGIHSIPPGIDSFDAESDLVESVLNRDISIDSSPKIDSLSNEFAGELILPKSIPPEIEEVEFDPEGDILFLESLLYDNSSPRPPEALQANSNAIESLPPSHIPVADNDSLMEEIDLFLADDGSIPPGIESDDVDSVDDDTSISLPEFESFYVDYPNSGNSTIDVVEDIPVDVPNVLPTHPILEQDFIPTSEFFAYVVWIFLPFLAYPVIPPSLLSCGDEDTIFDPGISKVSFF
ncbi:hypothetical protein Tco_0978628 [Tanacetum coccineum]|uniref:Uncharacterized protein n=2 Tax=Tanacetum coccineum TaxID=301880 RepID=A0ABQ5ENI6_9ASTR